MSSIHSTLTIALGTKHLSRPQTSKMVTKEHLKSPVYLRPLTWIANIIQGRVNALIQIAIRLCNAPPEVEPGLQSGVIGFSDPPIE